MTGREWFGSKDRQPDEVQDARTGVPATSLRTPSAGAKSFAEDNNDFPIA
jgi:hypothetical protein